MTFPLMIHLNSTIMAMAPSLFYTMIYIEITLHCFALSVLPFVFVVIASAKEDWLIFAADMIKDQFLGYFISILGSLSFERFIATHYWRWYERRQTSTLIILGLVEIFGNVPSWINVVLCEFGYIRHEMNMILFAAILAFSISLYIHAVRYNRAALRALSGRSGRYSVSHAFQVKENLNVLKFVLIFTGSSLPTICVCFGCFVVFFFAPNGWDLERFLCMELLDFSIALYAPLFIYVAVTRMPEYHQQLYKIRAFAHIADFFGWEPPRILREVSTKGIETGSYFSQLSLAWA